MENAKREAAPQSRSIHLVPKQQMDGDVTADLFQSSLQTPQSRFRIITDFLSSGRGSADTRERETATSLDPATVLRELFELLEDYAPVWYTEENHDRAVAALKLPMR